MLTTAACSSSSSNVESGVSELGNITPQQWEHLSKRAIYFGHQSVGENILDGIRDITAANPQIRLQIISGNATDRSPGLKEFAVGQNGDTDSKNSAFIAATQGELGPAPVLMFKYCY